MIKILISINPEHVRNILNNNKKYEYRRTIAKHKVDKILIYETSPTKMIVAEVKVKKILCDTPEKLWNNTKTYSGITKDFFDKYFSGKKIAYAYELGEIRKFSKPKKLSDFSINYAPQSFIYV